MDSQKRPMWDIKELILNIDQEIRSIFIILIICFLVDCFVLLPAMMKITGNGIESEVLLHSMLIGHILLYIMILFCVIAVIIYISTKIKHLFK